jgi:hypothetical protein
MLGTGALFFAAGPGPVASPSPVPSPSLTMRAVEPGVTKVIDDGAGHKLDGLRLAGVATGPDGGVWLLRATGPEPSVVNGVLVLGEPGVASTGALAGNHVDLSVTPDGTLWAVSSPGGRLRSFDGNAWTEGYSLPGRANEVEVAGDGTVWAAWNKGTGKPEAGYLGPDGWRPIDSTTSPATYVGNSQYLAVTPAGEAWLGVAFYHDMPEGEGRWRGLLRADASGWVVEHPVGERDDLSAGPMAAGADGTVWVYLATDAQTGAERYLARRDQQGWTSYSADDGVPLLVGNQVFEARIAVAGDGTLWIALDDGDATADLPPALGPHRPHDCAGVLSFDGATWRQYLVGTCVDHVAFAADGSVWATAQTGQTDDSGLGDREVPERAGLYLIDPAVAAAGAACATDGSGPCGRR